MSDALAVARLLEIRTVEVVTGRGRAIALSSVRCPLRKRSSAVEECASCRGGGGVARDALSRGGYLACRGFGPVARGGARDCASVGDAMRGSAVALRPRLRCTVAADELRARGEQKATVVEGNGRPVGVVSEADLLRAPPAARVGDAMTRVALAVDDSVPLGSAASLMASHRLERLPVVSADGVMVGVLCASDVLGWLAVGPEAAAADAPGVRHA